MRILAIETSCDETAIAIADFGGSKAKPKIRVLSHILASQTKVHAKFGGVVPNLARREHQKNLVPILLEAIRELGIMNYESGKKRNIPNSRFLPPSLTLRRTAPKLSVLPRLPNSILDREPELLTRFEKHIMPLAVPDIDAIAVTNGPGLEPALWVGVNFARALAMRWSKPLIPVNHMAGHLYSALLQAKPRISNFQFPISKKIQHSAFSIQHLRFPAVALLVSGGHTQLVLMKGHGKYQTLGETRDDAAGEAFDKVARLLGLGGIQGGPAIAASAEEAFSIHNSAFSIKLPRPMLHSKDYDFSFSGLKTAVLYKVRELEKEYSIKELRPVIANEFQDAAVEVLVKKTMRAAQEYKAKTVLLGGGVAANSLLRETLGNAIGQNLPNAKYLIPDAGMTGDNALMIAIAAFFTGKKAQPENLKANANLNLS